MPINILEVETKGNLVFQSDRVRAHPSGTEGPVRIVEIEGKVFLYDFSVSTKESVPFTIASDGTELRLYPSSPNGGSSYYVLLPQWTKHVCRNLKKLGVEEVPFE